jgi:hypothetical protein
MWESRVRCGISKRGGNGGKVGVGLFHGSHGASFPQPSSGFWAILPRLPSLGTTGGSIPHFQNPRQMHIFPDSCGEPEILTCSSGHSGHDQLAGLETAVQAGRIEIWAGSIGDSLADGYMSTRSFRAWRLTGSLPVKPSCFPEGPHSAFRFDHTITPRMLGKPGSNSVTACELVIPT